MNTITNFNQQDGGVDPFEGVVTWDARGIKGDSWKVEITPDGGFLWFHQAFEGGFLRIEHPFVGGGSEGLKTRLMVGFCRLNNHFTGIPMGWSTIEGWGPSVEQPVGGSERVEKLVEGELLRVEQPFEGGFPKGWNTARRVPTQSLRDHMKVSFPRTLATNPPCLFFFWILENICEPSHRLNTKSKFSSTDINHTNRKRKFQ